MKAAVAFVRQQVKEVRAEAALLQNDVAVASSPDAAIMAAVRFKASREALTKLEAVLKALEHMDRDPSCIPIFVAGWKPLSLREAPS